MGTSTVSIRPQPEPVAFLIPGIGIAYSKAVKLLSDNLIFQKNCACAGLDGYLNVMGDSASNCEVNLSDTLDNQKLSYVANCTMSDLYNKAGIVPQLVVGYSMGIYSALYAAGYYSFETGLSIVEEAFRLIEELCSAKSEKYGMGLVLGLTESDFRELLFKEVVEGVDIAVYNGKRSFVIAGEEEKLDFCLDKAAKIGAFGVSRILTEHPYHTLYLKGISAEFWQFLDTCRYFEPRSTAISLIDGQVISRDEVSDVIVRSIYSALHLDIVINTLVSEHGILFCHEAGPAQSMKKLVRYIDRNVKVRPFGEEMVK